MHIVIDGQVWENNSFSIHNKNLVCALHRLGYDVRLEAWGQGRAQSHHEAFIDHDLLDMLASLPKDYDSAVTIRQSWPRCDPYYDPRYNWDKIQGRHKIGLLAWESEHLPTAWLDNMRTVDAILAVSPFSADRMQQELCSHAVETPVWGVPLGVDRRLFNPAVLPTARFDGARMFRFLHVGVGQPRKGSDLLREAYLAEFTDTDDVTLVIKTGGWDSVAAWTEGLVRQPHAPHLLIIHDNNIPETEMGGLYTACNCLVHPARLEGFGMTMLEAMACGVPVLCTEKGAHRVFANESNSILVSCVEEQFGFFQNLVGVAYRVEHNALRKAMRKVASLGPRWDLIAAGLQTAEEFSWQRCAERIVALIEQSFGPLEKRSEHDRRSFS